MGLPFSFVEVYNAARDNTAMARARQHPDTSYVSTGWPNRRIIPGLMVIASWFLLRKTYMLVREPLKK